MQTFHTIARYYCYVFSFFKLGKKHRELPLEIQPLIFYSSPLSDRRVSGGQHWAHLCPARDK
jgi:hypothetical protein